MKHPFHDKKDDVKPTREYECVVSQRPPSSSASNRVDRADASCLLTTIIFNVSRLNSSQDSPQLTHIGTNRFTMSSESSSAAQREARRRRFFAAISSTPPRDQQQSQPKTKPAPQEPKSESNVKGDEQTKSSTTASTSTSASPLSAELTDKLMHIYHHEANKPCVIPPGPMGDAMATAFSKKLMATPPSQLPPGLVAFQRKVLEIDASMKELEKVPIESLPPELQQLKRQTEARIAEKREDPYGYDQAGLEINQLLRDNDEHELPFAELSACAGRKNRDHKREHELHH